MDSIREGWGKGWIQEQDRKEETCKNMCTAKEYREDEKSQSQESSSIKTTLLMALT